MRVIETSFTSPWKNIAYDEELLSLAEENGSQTLLRFWEPKSYFVSLGVLDSPENSVYQDICRADHIPVLKRHSGGGTVLLGPGCLNYSVILPINKASRDVRKSYVQVLERICNCLVRFGYQAEIKDVSDITLGNRKISGNAQIRKRRYLLQHGTLLYNFDIDLVTRYLQEPRRKPAYRGSRTHREFLTSMSFPSSEPLKQEISRQFSDFPATIDLQK